MIGGWKYLATLPAGEWKMIKMPHERILFICKDHAPRILVEGELWVIQ